jgi:hypothetical protein
LAGGGATSTSEHGPQRPRRSQGTHARQANGGPATARILDALGRLSRDKAGVGVPVAQIEEAIGRGHGDMRTPLNLQSLNEEGLAEPMPEGSWALTAEGVAWLKQDRELSNR